MNDPDRITKLAKRTLVVKGFYSIGVVALIVSMHLANALPQTGGDFAINQSVISGGGGASTDIGSEFSVTGTIGQPKAGDYSNGGSFNVRTGFWTPSLSPTAAHVSVSGRVKRASGDGIRGVTVTLIGPTTGESRTYLTSSMGHFVFEDLEVGATYMVSVSHTKYGFAEPSRSFLLLDDLTDLDFVAAW